MTYEDEPRPELDDARHAVEESLRRAEQDMTCARERAHRWLDLADKLRQLREENGFHQLFEEAFGGGRG